MTGVEAEVVGANVDTPGGDALAGVSEHRPLVNDKSSRAISPW
jgi:hypothetical protein